MHYTGGSSANTNKDMYTYMFFVIFFFRENFSLGREKEEEENVFGDRVSQIVCMFFCKASKTSNILKKMSKKRNRELNPLKTCHGYLKRQVCRFTFLFFTSGH